MAIEKFEVTTTQNSRGQLPKVNDEIVVDGIPGRVLWIDPFQGFRFRVMIPGLRDADGNQQFLDEFVPWSRVLDLSKTSPGLIDEVINL